MFILNVLQHPNIQNHVYFAINADTKILEFKKITNFFTNHHRPKICVIEVFRGFIEESHNCSTVF